MVAEPPAGSQLSGPVPEAHGIPGRGTLVPSADTGDSGSVGTWLVKRPRWWSGSALRK
jgi:hypothetical protein